MISDESNRNNLRSIEQSIFILCLDGALNDGESRRDDVGVAQQMIHGCGSRHFSANRWFDKTLQVRDVILGSLIFGQSVSVSSQQ